MYLESKKKNSTNERICSAGIETHIENRFVDTSGEGEGGTNWENSMETYTSLYVKYVAGGKLLGNTGSSTRRSVTT